MIFGTFDIFHKGHENFLKQAKQYGDYLIVIIARDKTVLKIKGKLPRNNERKRLKVIGESKLADKAVLGSLSDKYKVIEKFKPNVICLGYDQVAFTEKLEEKLRELGLNKTKIIKLKSYKPKKYKSSKFKIMHTSVGAIIKNKNGKILMIDRAAFPFGWACPAGHVDENETPKQAIVREIKEEVNLVIRHAAANGVHANENNNVNYKLLIHEYVDWNECAKGVKGHDWYVYEIKEWSGRMQRSKRETKGVGWFNVEEIKKLDLEKIWKYWFEKLKIIQ